MKQNDREVNSKVQPDHILAGDVGATKTLVGIFAAGRGRPMPVTIATFATRDFTDLTGLLAAFFRDVSLSGGPTRRSDRVDDAREVGAVRAACFGIAGPVVGDVATLTNVAWRADAVAAAHAFTIPRIALVNDLHAMALAVPVLEPHELHTLQTGEPSPHGNMALIAAGTGLGEALLHRVDGGLVPAASEGGHADFAARTEREIEVLRALTARFGRVEVERVLSGPGLANLHRATHRVECHVVEDTDDPSAPGRISQAS